MRTSNIEATEQGREKILNGLKKKKLPPQIDAIHLELSLLFSAIRQCVGSRERLYSVIKEPGDSAHVS